MSISGATKGQEIASEETDCVVCANSDKDMLGQAPDMEYQTGEAIWQSVRCRKCGHIYLDPRPCLSQAERIYPDDYYTHAETGEENFVSRIRQRLEGGRYRELAPMLPRNPAILDVGYGDGRVLLMLRKIFGPSAPMQGLDLDPSERIQRKLEDHGIVCAKGLAETFSPGEQRFDLIVMTQIIEHLWDPRKVLANLRAALNPGGLLFIETPNPLCLGRKIQGNVFWGGFHRPRHLNLYTKNGFDRLAGDLDMEIVKYSQYANPAFWIIGWRLRRGLGDQPKTTNWREMVNLSSFPSLSFFTLVEIAAGLCGLGQSSHRVILRKPEK